MVTLLVMNGTTVDSASTLTDERGLFDVSAKTDAAPGARIDLHIHPANLPGYSIDSLLCSVTRVRGDGCVLDPIVPAPWFPFVARVLYRGSSEPAVGVNIRFTRTGGSQWVGPAAAASSSLSGTTDSGGNVSFFPLSLYASGLAPVLGDMVVDLPAPYGTSIQHDYAIFPTYLVKDRKLIFVEVGPSLRYGMTFLDSATNSPMSEVSLTFTRVSGIQVTPTTASGHSGADGRAILPLRALAPGSVTGTILIEPPGRSATTLSGQTLATFESDSTKILARWRVGSSGTLYPAPP